MTHFIAVIYDPLRERKPDDLIGGWSQLPPPIFPFSVQIPDGEFIKAAPTKGRGSEVIDNYFNQKYRNVFFRPSSNLDVSSKDWEFCLRDEMVQWRLGNGALEVVEPSKEAIEKEPNGVGFRMFALDKALYLVQKTRDLITLKEWSSLEERKVVVEAIAKQEEAIKSHLRKLREN